MASVLMRRERTQERNPQGECVMTEAEFAVVNPQKKEQQGLLAILGTETAVHSPKSSLFFLLLLLLFYFALEYSSLGLP